MKFDKLEDLSKELSLYSWDIEEPLIQLSKLDLLKVTNKCNSQIITVSELVDWANVIELREDIEFEDEELKEFIFELANPEINGEITKEKLDKILNQIAM